MSEPITIAMTPEEALAVRAALANAVAAREQPNSDLRAIECVNERLRRTMRR